MMIDYNLVKTEIEKILGADSSGHNMDHIYMVLKNADRILKTEPKADKDIVKLACFLHDVDDYKLVGYEQAEQLTNTYKVLELLDLSDNQKKHIVDIIKNMGYSKYLDGIRPNTLEGKIVSDADMCEVGSSGIIRTLQYSFKINRPIFNVDILPNKVLSTEEYQAKRSCTINYYFDRVLKNRDLMLTPEGKRIANKRHKIAVDFLENFFEERHEDCSKWQKLLEEYK